MTGRCVIAIPGDRIEWGPLDADLMGCAFQRAAVYVGQAVVCQITVQFPTPEPTVPVVSYTEDRHAGERD